MKITALDALQIFDSRGHPTIEVIATLEDGTIGRGLVPSGASTGSHEARELRDRDPGRFQGRSVFQAIGNVTGEIARVLVGQDSLNQAAIDAALIALDGTPDKSRLGANAVLGVSLAVAKAAAGARKMPLHASLGGGTLLPLPAVQIFGGGKHAQGRIDIQDFMIVALTATSYAESLEVASGVFHAAGAEMRSRGKLAGVADEGGHWPLFDRNEEVLEVLLASIERAGYTPGRDVGLSLDIAATDLHRDGHYRLGLEGRRFSSEDFAALMIGWVERYPIVSIEDPMAEDDWEGWRLVRNAIGHRCQLIGDDLFTTRLDRIERGIEAGAANAVLIKLNQIGTVTETLAAIDRTRAAGWLPVVSARSGETEDAFIAHLAVATDAGQLKVGSFTRGERLAKWNEVLRIGHELGPRARFVGAGLFESAGIRFDLAAPPH